MSLSAKGEGWEPLPIPAVSLLTEQLNSERAEVADPLGSLGWPGRGPGQLEPLPSGSSQPRRGSEPGTKVAVAMPVVMTGVTDAVWCGGEAGR